MSSESQPGRIQVLSMIVKPAIHMYSQLLLEHSCPYAVNKGKRCGGEGGGTVQDEGNDRKGNKASAMLP